jgi:predicted component of type VI protein secretion system
MINLDLFPPELRSASVEEQLAFLLERRQNLTQLIQSLERLQTFRTSLIRKPVASQGVRQRVSSQAA